MTLTRVIAEDESSSVTGINFGADVGYYFTETIGVGGLIRFGRASVDTSIGSLDVGGPEFGVGLRIRIPQARPRPRASHRSRRQQRDSRHSARLAPHPTLSPTRERDWGDPLQERQPN